MNVAVSYPPSLFDSDAGEKSWGVVRAQQFFSPVPAFLLYKQVEFTILEPLDL